MIANKIPYDGGGGELKLLRSVYYDANTDATVENNRKTAMDYLISTYGECIGLIRYAGAYCQYIIQKVGSSSWFVTEFYNDLSIRWDRGGTTWYKRGVEDFTITTPTNVTLMEDYSCRSGNVVNLNFTIKPTVSISAYTTIATLPKATYKRCYLGSHVGPVSFYTSGDSVLPLNALTANTQYTVTGTIMLA